MNFCLQGPASLQVPRRLTLRSASDPSTRESSVFSVWVLPERDASLPTCRWNSYSPRGTKGSPFLSHRSQFPPIHGDLSAAMNHEARTTAFWGARSSENCPSPKEDLKPSLDTGLSPNPRNLHRIPFVAQKPKDSSSLGNPEPPPSCQNPQCEGDRLHQQLGCPPPPPQGD